MTESALKFAQTNNDIFGRIVAGKQAMQIISNL
jgi:hypothetical protein